MVGKMKSSLLQELLLLLDQSQEHLPPMAMIQLQLLLAHHLKHSLHHSTHLLIPFFQLHRRAIFQREAQYFYLQAYPSSTSQKEVLLSPYYRFESPSFLSFIASSIPHEATFPSIDH